MRPRSILIVGNSFTGAVLKAAQERPEIIGQDLITFAAAGGTNFEKISTDGGVLTGVRTFNSQGQICVADYDSIFVYGLFPTPQEVFNIENDLIAQGYSRAVVAASLRNFIFSSPSSKLKNRISAASDCPVYVFSKNVRRDSAPMTRNDYDQGCSRIIDIFGSSYIPFPHFIFDDDMLPLEVFYKESVKLGGTSPTPDLKDKHDLGHMNASGGAVILASIMEQVRGLPKTYPTAASI